MTTLDQNPQDLRGVQRSLVDRLDAFGQIVRKRLLLEAGAWLAGIVVGICLLTFLLDRMLRLSHFTRRGLLLAFLAACGYYAWRFLREPLKLTLQPHLLAAALEGKIRKPVAARVATVLELPHLTGRDASNQMVQDAVTRSKADLDQIDFIAHLNPERRKKSLGAIYGTAGFCLLLILIFPGSVRLWAARLFFGSNTPWPQKTYLQIAGMTGERMVVPRGESFVLRTSAREGSESPDTVSLRWCAAGTEAMTVLLTKFGTNDFRYDFPPVQSDVSIELTGGDDVLGPLEIHPVDRPRVAGLKLTSQHPTENKPRIHNFTGEDSGELAFLPLTKMELTFTANTPIAEAKVTSSTTQPSGASVRRINDRQFALDWQHASATQLQIELVGEEARLASAPTSVAIGLKADKPPRATLGFSGVRQRVSPQATIPLVTEARDDYGIDRIELQIRTDLVDPNHSSKVATTATTQPIFGPATQPTETAETEVRQAFNFKVESQKLEPGHAITFTAAATDKSYPQSQTGASRQLVFRVVRAEELFKEILMRQQAERARFRKQLDDARQLRDLLGGPLAQTDVPLLSRTHRTVQREVTRVQIALTDSLTEMRLNVLGNADAHEMMEKTIIQPMKALDAELMLPQRDALDTLTTSDAAAVSSVAERQDQIVARLEAILKQMAQWDSFVDVLNQLNEIIRIETNLQKGTTQLKDKQKEGIFEP